MTNTTGDEVTRSSRAACIKALEDLGGVALDYEIAAKAGLPIEVVKQAMKALLKSEWVRLG